MGLTGRRNLPQPQISGERTKEQPRCREEGEQEPDGGGVWGEGRQENGRAPRDGPSSLSVGGQLLGVGPAHAGEQIPSQVLSRWL